MSAIPNVAPGDFDRLVSGYRLIQIRLVWGTPTVYCNIPGIWCVLILALIYLKLLIPYFVPS